MAISENKSIDIMFIVSPANAREVYMPFYFLYLAGYLEKYGYFVEIVNPHEKHIKGNFKAIINEIITKKPKLVGLASFVTDYNIISNLATEIKKCSDTRIIVGNVQPSIAPEDFLYENSPFDIVVRGEGELTVKQLLEEFNRMGGFNEARDLGHINGIAYFENGTVKITKNRGLMNLADCGMPAYHKIDVEWYRKPTKYIIRRLATVGAVIYTGRGCPYRCAFCASNSVWQANDKSHGNPLVRRRPLMHVIDELRILQDVYHFDFFYILDDTFGVREKDIIEFCSAYRESGLKMLWAAESRVSCIQNEEIVKILKEAGCIQLDFGVESGSPRLLKSVNKGITVEQTIQAFDLCRKYGMRTFANILLNLPGEEKEDLTLTHKLLARIKPSFTSVGITQPYPGTNIYKKLGKPILKEDYHKLSRLLPLEEYRLSSHKLNLKKLLLKWQIKYGLVPLFEKSLFKADIKYWSIIIRSESRWLYMYFLVKEILIMPLRSIVHLRHFLLK